MSFTDDVKNGVGYITDGIRTIRNFRDVQKGLQDSFQRGNEFHLDKWFKDDKLKSGALVAASVLLARGAGITSWIGTAAATYVAVKYVAPVIIDQIEQFTKHYQAQSVVDDFVKKNPNFKGKEQELLSLHKEMLNDMKHVNGLQSIMDLSPNGKFEGKSIEAIKQASECLKDKNLDNVKFNLSKLNYRFANEPSLENLKQDKMIESSKENVIRTSQAMPGKKVEVEQTLDPVKKDEEIQRAGLAYNRKYDIDHGYPVAEQKPIEEILHPSVAKSNQEKQELPKFHMNEKKGSLKTQEQVGKANDKDLSMAQ